MDEDAGVCFFRCVIPCAEKEISEEILLGYLNTCKTVCEQFFASIGVLAATGNLVFYGFSLLVGFIWLDARIKASQARHSRACKGCRSSCKEY